jgi:hypothetical protein
VDIGEKTCCIHYGDTWLSKWVYWLSKSQCANCSHTNYRCENTEEFDTGVAWASLPITRIHQRVANESTLQWLPATLHNTGCVSHCQACHGSFMAILVLGPVDVENAYRYSASRHHCLQWHIELHWWRDASFASEEDTMEATLILCYELCLAEAVQILY